MKYLRKFRHLLFAVCIGVLFLGCATRGPQDILSTTESVLGIDISQSPGTSSPHVKLGFIRSQFHIVPSSTNGPVYAPPLNSSIAIGQRLTSTDIDEDFETGAATGIVPTNSVARVSVAAKAAAKAPQPPPQNPPAGAKAGANRASAPSPTTLILTPDPEPTQDHGKLSVVR